MTFCVKKAMNDILVNSFPETLASIELDLFLKTRLVHSLLHSANISNTIISSTEHII